MDWGHDERGSAAGHPGRAPRLGDGAWADMVANVRATVERERDPRRAGGSLADVKESRDDLRGVGL